MSRKRNNKNSIEWPSSAKPRKEIIFKIERKTFIQVIILLLIILIVLGCTIGQETKTVYCKENSQVVKGWVSAESTQSYWVVDGLGKIMEFSKNKCSIRG